MWVMPASMLARLSCPWARRAWTACAWLTPTGSCLLRKPSKMRLVARARILGADTLHATLTTAKKKTTASIARSGRSLPTSLLNDPLKSLAFSPVPMSPGGPKPGPWEPRPRPRLPLATAGASAPGCAPSAAVTTGAVSAGAIRSFRSSALMPLPPHSTASTQSPGRSYNDRRGPYDCRCRRHHLLPAPRSGRREGWY